MFRRTYNVTASASFLELPLVMPTQHRAHLDRYCRFLLTWCSDPAMVLPTERMSPGSSESTVVNGDLDELMQSGAGATDLSSREE